MTRREHHCHALNCDTDVPPRLHMCPKHWRMVPKALKDALWGNYRRGQERDMQPSPAYLRAAAACVRSVAEQERQPEDKIVAECRIYLDVAEFFEEADDAPES